MSDPIYLTTFTDKLSERGELALSTEQTDVYIRTITSLDLPFEIIIYDNDQATRMNKDHKTIHLDYYALQVSSEKIINRILVLAGQATKVHARKTVVTRISKQTAIEFQQEHHLQEAIEGKYRYGLYHEGELMTIALFNGARIMHNISSEHRSFELIRFCHKATFIVIGGLSKIIKRFVTDFSPDDIMTYVDLDWAQTSSLKTLSFEVQNRIGPLKYWVNPPFRWLIKSISDEEKYKKMFPHGFVKYNSGSIKMTLKLGK